MKIFKNRGQYESQTQNGYSPQNFGAPSAKAVQPASSQNGLPQVGSHGIFMNTTDIGPYGNLHRSRISEIRNNRFFDENGEPYKYFAYDSPSSPEVFQVAFGNTVCRKKVAVSNTPAPARNTDVPRCTGVMPQAPNDRPVMVVGETYLFTNDPEAGFVKGTFASTPGNSKRFVAMIEGNYREFVFAITMADYEAGRKNRLICACGPKELQREAPRQMPQGRAQQPQTSSRQSSREDGLQPGQEVYAFNEFSSFSPKVKTTFTGVAGYMGFTTAHGTFKFVIPADMVKNGDVDSAEKFYLAVRNGEIYAPNFQR